MNRVDRLFKAYERFVAVPWPDSLAGPQRVWFLVYDPVDERRVRARLSEFELATMTAKHPWLHVDVTDSFGTWMTAEEYRESYFEEPVDLDLLIPEFEDKLIGRILDVVTSDQATADSVVAITGIASVFGLTKASVIIKGVAEHVRGRLLVFFPGTYENNVYRLLDARDGWSYLAVPILADEGGAS